MPTNKIILVFILFLSSCDYLKKQSIVNNVSTIEIPDTAKPAIVTTYPGKTFPGIFEAAFYAGTQATQNHESYHFFKYDLGRIKIESGKMIACDPIVMQDASPFIDTFPTGSFVVNLAMAKRKNDQRVAFSRIVFSDSPVATWECARRQGQKPISMADSMIYCYGVDGGTGMFIDSVSNSLFSKKDHTVWENVFINDMKNNDYIGLIHDFDEHNFAMFSTGYGDGCYATYIGRDRAGKICRLLTDFQLIDWWKLGPYK